MKRHLECAEQQVSPSNLTKYCACHEKWLDCFIILTYETSFPMRGATGVTIQPRQILRLPRKMTLQDFKENLQKQVKRHFQCGADPTMIRAWSENENANRNPPRKWGYFARSPEAFSIVKYNVLHPILQSNFHQILQLEALDLRPKLVPSPEWQKKVQKRRCFSFLDCCCAHRDDSGSLCKSWQRVIGRPRGLVTRWAC